jgi:hypothetical protein
VSHIRQDPDHEAVLASSARHLVVTAPPGTGKTFLSIRLAGQLISALNLESRVLVLTFSNQARTQLEIEAARQLPSGVRARIEITNYHRFFWQGVRAYTRALGLPSNLDIGSRKRRQHALERVDNRLVRRLARREGVIESLAEHGFAEFRDHRTPDQAILVRLLAVVEAEQQAGRLVFDDLGALFWSLIERFPVIDQAYRKRYPVVIADEHQDASALQDALVRRLGQKRLVVFADPMQLIHEFRGASRERLDRHLAECDLQLTLNTPHRWHGSREVAEWLLAVRGRLEGGVRDGVPPTEVKIQRSPAIRGFNGVKSMVRFAVARAFEKGARTIAVLCRTNPQVAELRSYLSQQGQHPRHVGTDDFEEARVDIEQLPLLRDSHSVALHAVSRMRVLLPTIPPSVWNQVVTRVGPTGVSLRRAGQDAGRVLRALEPLYRDGPGAYFGCLFEGLMVCAEAGHHVPRVEALRTLRITAQALQAGPVDLDLALQRYSAAVIAASHVAPRLERGLFVMTAHQAKGKEFDAVLLADGSARFWPDNEESRRLFYVTVTRATKFWTVIIPDSGGSTLVRFLTGSESSG